MNITTTVVDIGYYALGLFVGAIISYALVKVEDWSKPIPIVTGLLGAAVSGTIMVFLEQIGGDTQAEALALYPIGLANALVWVFVHHTTGRVRPIYMTAVGTVTAIIMFLLILDPLRTELCQAFGWLCHSSAATAPEPVADALTN